MVAIYISICNFPTLPGAQLLPFFSKRILRKVILVKIALDPAYI